MKYRKRPVVIEAFQWFGSLEQTEDPVWACEAVETGKIAFADKMIHIHTLEGIMSGEQGDWIIKGIEGEIYPCKPSIFAATYEVVEQSE